MNGATMTTWEPFATWATTLTWFIIAGSIGIIVCLLVLVILRIRARRKNPSGGAEGRGHRVSVAQLTGVILFLVATILNGIPIVIRESAPIANTIGTPLSLILLAAGAYLLAQRRTT